VKTVKLTDAGQLRNELARYRKGRKLEIAQFNQAARLAWLGLVALAPLDPDDPTCEARLLHCLRPEGLAEGILHVDEFLYSRIHVLDAEQGAKLAEILRDGIEARARELEALDRRDFYFDKFFDPDARRGS